MLLQALSVSTLLSAAAAFPFGGSMLDPMSHISKRALGPAWSGTTTIAGGGTTGVSAQQISVVDEDHIIIFDKAERNPLQVDGKPAWGALYEISTKSVRALGMKTNSFCAGGGWLGNGTLVSVGGNPRENVDTQNGLQALRLFTPCGGSGTCQVEEWPTTVRLTTARWYATTVRLEDGSLIVMGGMAFGGYNNNAQLTASSFEFWPPKGNGIAVYSKFLQDALNTNLFPISYMLPGGKLFVAANKLAMLYDWKTNTEQRLPNLPHRVNYPSSSSSVLLPMTAANNWTPDVLMCGGTELNTDGDPSQLSARTLGTKRCMRMTITPTGIAQGWRLEDMPTERLMGCGVLTPDGKVFITGGARSGVAGYGNVRDQVGFSNAAIPNFAPILYDPDAAAGSRFTTNFPAAASERLYHSSATLLPDGRILTSGSNPNPDVETRPFATRYDVEIYSPPYVQQDALRPTFQTITRLDYNQAVTLRVNNMFNAKTITAVIMDLGYSTHGVYMNNRHVELRSTRSVRSRTITITGPQSKSLYQPGYAYLYLIADGIPSKGVRVMIGDGANPPLNTAALDNMRKTSDAPSDVVA